VHDIFELGMAGHSFSKTEVAPETEYAWSIAGAPAAVCTPDCPHRNPCAIKRRTYTKSGAKS
jgi:hypothetical protein